MTGTAVLDALFGAGLVALGVLAAALADRIRGLRISRDRPHRTPAAELIHVVESAAQPRTPAPKSEHPRASRAEPKADGAEDVITALVAAGYKKSVAAAATWDCNAGERASIEGWTAAALRRCAHGGMS